MRFPWQKAESDLEREVDHHLEQLAADFEAQGHSPAEARRRARLAFGGLDQVKELCRDESRWQWLSHLRQDLDFGWRMLRKTPIVTTAAVLSLALGIGANTAILSLVDAVLWRSLPGVAVPEQLSFVLWQAKGNVEGLFQSAAGAMYRDGSLRVANFFSYSAFEKLREQVQDRAQIAGFLYSSNISSSYEGRTAVAHCRAVSGNFFAVLGVVPAAGRLLQPADDESSAPATVIVSHRFFETILGGDSRALGRSIRINNRPFIVTGVLPAAFGGLHVGDATDLYVPFHHSAELSPDSFANPRTWWVELVARRAPGVTPQQLQPVLQSLFRSTWVQPEPKDSKAAPSVRLEEGTRGLGGLRRQFGSPLAILAAVVSMVLLIACANIANLLLARADARRKEVALRVSLGGSPSRILRQFLTESAVLAGLGGLLSLAFAWSAANLIVKLIPGNEPVYLPIAMDGRLLLATFGFTSVTVLIFGLFPAWRATRLDVAPALKEGAGSMGAAGRSWWTPGKILVVAQVAIAIFLVAAGALFVRNLQRIQDRDAGFDRRNLLVFDLRPGETGYEGAKRVQFYQELERRLAGVPGVTAVSIGRVRPMAHYGWWDDVVPEGERTKPMPVAMNQVSPGHASVLGLRLLAGRFFVEADRTSKTSVVVVSDEVARRIGPSALGSHLRQEGTKYLIVGIVANAAYSDLQERPPVVYHVNKFDQPGASITLRTSAPPLSLFPAIREVVRQLDRDLPIVDPLTMEQQIAETLRRERLFAYLCGGFGLLAILLSVIGLYGVISYQTARRRAEIGIRMALGAAPAQILRLVLQDGLILVGLGLALGAPMIYFSSAFVEKQLFEMKPLDPVSLLTALALLGSAALLAALIPALRASADSPTAALRQD